MYASMLGQPVEYHGSHHGYYGHEMRITHRARTVDGYRYILADEHGHRLTNVAPGSVTPCRPGRHTTWHERLDAVHARATTHGGTDYVDQLAPYLAAVARDVTRRAFVDAQRQLLALERATGVITTDEYTARLARVNASHGAPQIAA